MRFAYSGIARRPDRGGPRPAESVGRGVSAIDSRASLLRTPFYERHVALGAKHGRLRRLGDAAPVPDRHRRRAPGHAPRGRPLRRLATWAASSLRGAGAARLPAARPHQQRRGAGPVAGAVHLHPHRRPAAPSTTPTSTASSRTSTCWWSTPPTAQRTGSTSSGHARAASPTSSSTRRAPARSPCSPCRARASREILAGPHRARRAARAAPQRARSRRCDHRPAARRACGSPAPATPASRSASSCSCRRSDGAGRSGTCSSRAGAVPVRPRRARHPAPGGRPAALRPRAGRSTPRATRSPSLSCPLATLRGELLAAARATSSAARRCCASTRPTGASWPATTRSSADLPRLTRPVAVTGRGVARAGAPVFRGRPAAVGWVTSGTMVPYWEHRGRGPALAHRPTSTTCAPSAWPSSTAACVEDDEVERRHPRQARPRPRRALPPAQRRAALRPAHRLATTRRSSREPARRRGRREGARLLQRRRRQPRVAAATSASTSSPRR